MCLFIYWPKKHEIQRKTIEFQIKRSYILCFAQMREYPYMQNDEIPEAKPRGLLLLSYLKNVSCDVQGRIISAAKRQLSYYAVKLLGVTGVKGYKTAAVPCEHKSAVVPYGSKRELAVSSVSGSENAAEP